MCQVDYPSVYAKVVFRNKVWSIWWVQIWSTLIYCHREFEYMQSCKWEPIAGQNQVLILPFFSVLLLYHFTIVIISDKKNIVQLHQRNLFTAIFQLCVVMSSLCVTSSNRFCESISCWIITSPALTL